MKLERRRCFVVTRVGGEGNKNRSIRRSSSRGREQAHRMSGGGVEETPWEHGARKILRPRPRDRFPARKALWETGRGEARAVGCCFGGETENCGIAKGGNNAK